MKTPNSMSALLFCELIRILPSSGILLALVEETVLTQPIRDLELVGVVSSQICGMHRILSVCRDGYGTDEVVFGIRNDLAENFQILENTKIGPESRILREP